MHCGLCLEACPTYRILRNEADSPRGRIALMRGIAEGRIPMTPTVFKHLDGCLDCRACETACPAGVRYGDLIEDGRGELYPLISGSPEKNRIRRFFLTRVLTSPRGLRVLTMLLRIYQESGARFLVRKSGLLRFFPAWIREGEALLPEVPPRRGTPTSKEDGQCTVGLFRGCIAPILFPEVEAAAVRVLEKLGARVIVPKEQTCCGALLLHGGLKKEASALGVRNIKAFAGEPCEMIVTTAAGCGSALKEYPRFLPGAPDAGTFSGRILDFTQAVLRLGLPRNLKPVKLRIAYQDACHLIHAQKIKEEPRKLLQAIPGVMLLDLPKSDWCCGSAGIYNLTHPGMAAKILEEKIENLLSVNPDAVVVGNPGCALQIRMGLRKSGKPLPVYHPAEILRMSLEENET